MTASNWLVLRQPTLAFLIALGWSAVLLQMRAAGVLDPDTYYHFTVIRGIAENGWPWLDISWLPYTVLGEAGPDHHWLWHLFLAPFGFDPNPERGMLLAICFSFALVPAGLTLLLQFAGVSRHAWLWALLALVAGEVVLGRLLMLRVQNLALLLVFASTIALYRRSLGSLLAIGFVFMESYHGAVVLGPIAVIYLFWSWLGRGVIDFKPVLWLGLGVALGLLITPWPGDNISYLLFHTLYKTGTGLPGMAGTEWAHLGLLDILRQAWMAHLILLGSSVLWWRLSSPGPWRTRLGSGLPGLMLLVCLLFLLLFFQAWRFVEYYAPLAVITGALLLGDIGVQQKSKLERPVAIALLVLLLAGAIGASGRVLQAKAYDVADYAAVIEYLDRHAAEGEVVVNSHWPDFPMLLWPQARYRMVAGLDGSYLAFQDPERFVLWWQLAARDYGFEGDIAQRIASAFDSRWVLVNRGHELLFERLQDSPSAHLVSTSRAAYLFEIRPLPAPAR